MLKLNKKLEYAMIALQHMCRNEGLVSAKEISLQYVLPFDGTSRVLQIMAQKNWLISEQGPNGGYKINEAIIAEVSLFDLVEAIEGEHAVVRCLVKNADCPILSHCNLMSPMERLNTNLKDFLKQQNVLDLILERNLEPGWKEEVGYVGS